MVLLEDHELPTQVSFLWTLDSQIQTGYFLDLGFTFAKIPFETTSPIAMDQAMARNLYWTVFVDSCNLFKEISLLLQSIRILVTEVTPA